MKENELDLIDQDIKNDHENGCHDMSFRSNCEYCWDEKEEE